MFFLLLISLLFFYGRQPILASDFNSFGLHLTQPSDIDSAAKIINSNGGDWGYATIVIRTDQLDVNTWQGFFNQCRKLHIIPIIRLATTMENDQWKKPEYSDIDNLAIFLNSLNWPVITKYIIPFNEINHAKEWGVEINIKDFVDKFIYTSEKFIALDKNFFILSTPLDLAPPDKIPITKSASQTYREIYNYNPKYFDSFHGLASHSYPNQAFIGTPSDTHAHSIKGYLWELDFIKKLGIQKTYPVFITETGWPHREGKVKNNHYYSVKTSAKFLKEALGIWEKEPRIKAVTPFTYNYSEPPFDVFSWLQPDGQLYPEYQQIVDLPKKQNHPEQITSWQVTGIRLPFFIFTGHLQNGSLNLKNSGQSIWGETNFCINNQSSNNVVADHLCTQKIFTYPGQIQKFNFSFTVQSASDNSFLQWQNTPRYEITAINPSATLYHPKDNFFNRIFSFLKN